VGAALVAVLGDAERSIIGVAASARSTGDVKAGQRRRPPADRAEQ
jgi:hypothetical protein